MLFGIKVQKNYEMVYFLTINAHKHTILLPKPQHQITRVSDLNWYCPRAHTHAERRVLAHTLNAHLEGHKQIHEGSDANTKFLCLCQACT